MKPREEKDGMSHQKPGVSQATVPSRERYLGYRILVSSSVVARKTLKKIAEE